jgi:hypothetical protein
MRNQPSLQRLIPRTTIRHLYELLRDFPKEEFQLAVANELCRRPEQLAKMVAESRDHFAFYDNSGEGFHNRGNQGLLTDARLNSRHLANTLVQQLAVNAGHVVSATQYNFQYVDYDISPLRTTGSEFENGKSGKSSEAGGMDILLSNQQDRTPIVGEIKADTDVNPFFGLIQNLMYAVEVSTPPQRARLIQFYPERFATSSLEPRIDIYLFLLRYPRDTVSQDFLSLTNRMSSCLLADKSMSDIVRRIVVLESPMEQNILNGFTVAFAHGD